MYFILFHLCLDTKDKIIEFKDALDIIIVVDKYLNLGVQLLIPPEKLKEIEDYQESKYRKIKLLKAWFEHCMCPTYGILYHALLQPSVKDTEAVRILTRKLPGAPLIEKRGKKSVVLVNQTPRNPGFNQPLVL